jgi:DnaJ like chaperone protein
MTIWENLTNIVSGLGSGSAVLLDRITSAVRGLGAGDRQKSVAFTVAMIALSAKMAKADGVVTADEIRAFKELFEVPEGEERNVARLFNLAKQDVAGFDAYARRIAELYPDDPATLEDIVDGLFHIAKADNFVHEAELAYLQQIAAIFGIEDSRFELIQARHVRRDGIDPYAVLGVAVSAADDDIKRHYRKLVAETHPDKLIARGVPEEFVRIANDRLAALNDAWSRIRLERGI